MASNIVEGCARRTDADYPHFRDVTHGSAHGLCYQLSPPSRLGYPDGDQYRPLKAQCDEMCKALNGLIRSLR